MQIRNTPSEDRASSEPTELPQGLPADAEIQHVAFVNQVDPAQTTLMEFKEPRSCRAILLTGSAARPPSCVTVLLVPTNDLEDPALTAKVWAFVEPDVPPELRRGFLIMLHGARIIWTPGRAGLIASADRLEALRRAVVDFSFHDGEIRDIEAELAQVWPHLKADTPLSFRFDVRAMARRDELAGRFEQVVGMRARLVRVDPAIHRPPVHPPTLASQLGERLKERTQIAERIEFVDGQLELLESVYEMCAQRSNEFVIARNEARLEWIVIVLLAVETLALIIDLMTATGS